MRKCNCGALEQEKYRDSLNRDVLKYSCGSVSIEDAAGRWVVVNECPRVKEALASIRSWVETRR